MGVVATSWATALSSRMIHEFRKEKLVRMGNCDPHTLKEMQHGSLSESSLAGDTDDDDCKIESAQPVSDTFCERIPELSRLLQLEHHQCVRLLKAVYGLVNAPRRWYHRVATHLRNMGGDEYFMEPCLWIFRDAHGVMQALCWVYVDDFMLACSDSPRGKRTFDGIDNLYERGTWESRVFTQCGGARVTQPYDKHQNMERI